MHAYLGAKPQPHYSFSPFSNLFSRSSSSSSGHGYIPLGVPKVANLLVKMRQHRTKAKAHHIESSSGPEPLTHPALRDDGAVSPRKVPLEENATFVCRDGVDAAKLIRAVRGSLYQKALDVGANVLVDEQCVSYVAAGGWTRAHSRGSVGGRVPSVDQGIGPTGLSGSMYVSFSSF